MKAVRLQVCPFHFASVGVRPVSGAVHQADPRTLPRHRPAFCCLKVWFHTWLTLTQSVGCRCEALPSQARRLTAYLVLALTSTSDPQPAALQLTANSTAALQPEQPGQPAQRGHDHQKSSNTSSAVTALPAPDTAPSTPHEADPCLVQPR